jgi:hypothetical protein
MRVVHAAGSAVVVLLLASMASAQGLGDAAAREREKRKAAPAGPARVITERDLGPASAMPATPVEEPAPGAPPAAGAETAAQAGAGAGAAAGAGAEPAAPPGQQSEGQPGAEAEQAAAEALQQARAEWQGRLDEARHEETALRESIGRLEAATSDPNAMYSPGWTRAMNELDEKKKQLPEVQARIAALESEGQKAGYR